MSSNAGKSFGTNSPPLEATGSEKPMGVGSVGGGEPAFKSDGNQRDQYFTQQSTGQNESGSDSAEKPQEKVKTD
ncbi:hypothetical protein EIP91_003061 [Steccherinum ochraceum]|uniref:Uncharacterized protein n=1 Tax=Steccherinum ochraceum TaxID=92696 RepID=A0A4R0RAX7_9APHY|nr:hypothetical protein EIP91_003061 [Steccherinum ochraceum]